MKINKKLVLSILVVGMLACIASAGTWAYFQDTIISNGNGIKTGSIALWVNNKPADPNNVVTVPGVEDYNVLPDPTINGQDYVPENPIGNVFKIQNWGTMNGKLYVQLQPTVESLGSGSGVQIDLYNGATEYQLYSNGINYAPVTSDPVYVCDVPSGGALTTLNLMYRLADTGENQNNLEGKELKFNLIYTLKPTQ